MKVGTLTASLVLDTRRFTVQIAKAEHSLRRLAISTRTMARDMANVGMRLGFYVTAPIVGLGTAMIKAASDAEETKQKFDVVFRGVGKQAAKTTREVAKNWDLSARAAQEFMSDTGSFFQGLGFGRGESLKLSQSVVGLGADITSFLNLSDGVAGAMKRMISGMSGNSRAMRELKVVYKQGDPEFEKLKRQLMTTRGLTDAQARALTVLKMAFKQSKNAIGDYARTSGSAANRFRALTESVKDFLALTGKVVVKILKVPKILGYLSKKVKELGAWFVKLPKYMKKFIIFGALIAASLAPIAIGLSVVLFAFTAFFTVLSKVVLLASAAAGVFSFLASPIGALIAVVSAAVARFLYLKKGTSVVDDLGKSLQGLKRRLKNLAKAAVKAGPLIVGFFKNFSHNIRVIFKWLGQEWEKVIHNMRVVARFGLTVIMFTISAIISRYGPGITAKLTEIFLTAFIKIGEWAIKFMDALSESMGLTDYFTKIVFGLEKMSDEFGATFTFIVDMAKAAGEAIKDALTKGTGEAAKNFEVAFKKASEKNIKAFMEAQKTFDDKVKALDKLGPQGVLEDLKKEMGAAIKEGALAGKGLRPIKELVQEYIKKAWPAFAAQLQQLTLPALRLDVLDLKAGRSKKKGATDNTNAGAGADGLGGKLPPISMAAKFGSMEAFKINNQALAVQKKIEKNTQIIANNTNWKITPFGTIIARF